MKSISINYDVLLIILSAISALIAARDIILRKDKKWYKRISLAGWTLILISTGIGFITWEKIQSDSADKIFQTKQAKIIHEADKRDILKNVDSAINVYGITLKKNKAKNVTIIKQAKKIIENPVLEVFEDSTKFIVSDNKLFVRFVVRVFNDKIAYHLKFSFINLIKINGILKPATSKIEMVSDADIIIGKNKSYAYSLQMKYPTGKPPITDTSFMFIKVNYSNELGQSQPPLRELFFSQPSETYNDINDLKLKFLSEQHSYKNIKNFLITKGYW